MWNAMYVQTLCTQSKNQNNKELHNSDKLCKTDYLSSEETNPGDLETSLKTDLFNYYYPYNSPKTFII